MLARDVLWAQMKPESLQKVAETLRKAHHHYLGVTAYPPKPPNAPAAAHLQNSDIQSFTRAMDSAKEQWPGSDLCLVGAHGAVGSTNIDDPTDTLPPGFLQFLDAETLVRIPVGDPEDEGDQID
jgi:hypothetical protein